MIRGVPAVLSVWRLLKKFQRAWHVGQISGMAPAWPAPGTGGLFLAPTLAKGCFHSSKPSSHVISNSFTNSKRRDNQGGEPLILLGKKEFRKIKINA